MQSKFKQKRLKLFNYVKAIDFNDVDEIYILNGVITPKSDMSESFVPLDCKDCIVAPGFVDPQINGFGVCDFWQFPDFTKIDELRNRLAFAGIVAFCPTIITEEKDKVIKLIDHINAYIKQSDPENGAKILGIHLEGVFITKYGIHKSQFAVTELTPESIKPFIKNNVVLFTLAPELDKTGEAIKLLRNNNILVSIGHTNASYKEGNFAIKTYGLDCVTHMFNAMKGIEGFSHRDSSNSNLNTLELKISGKEQIDIDKDGIILAILKNKNILCTVIADGVHVNREIVAFLYKLKGKDYFALTTDMVSKEFFAYESKRGNLAGGQTTMEQCISNLIKWNICNPEEALLSASFPISNKLRVAKEIGLGQLNYGCQANITLWNAKENRIKGTIIGENVFLS